METFFLLISLCSAVKNEVKLEERINGMDIKQENNDSSNTRLKYPRNIGEFLDRNTPQLFLMQVNDETIKLIIQIQLKF